MREWEATMGEEAYAYLMKGLRAQQFGCYEDAILFFRESLSIRESPEAHNCLAQALSMVGQLEQAMAESQLALTLDGQFGDAYNMIGMNLIELQRLPEAKETLTRALGCKRHSEPGIPQENLGRVHEQLAEIGEAMRWYEAALAINPNLKCARTNLKRLRAHLN